MSSPSLYTVLKIQNLATFPRMLVILNRSVEEKNINVNDLPKYDVSQNTNTVTWKKRCHSRGHRREVVIISMSSARSSGRVSLLPPSSSSRKGFVGDTSSSCRKGGSGMPTTHKSQLHKTNGRYYPLKGILSLCLN